MPKETKIKVIITIFGNGEYESDTLESRMVDARLSTLEKEFNLNGVETKIVKADTPEEKTFDDKIKDFMG